MGVGEGEFVSTSGRVYVYSISSGTSGSSRRHLDNSSYCCVTLCILSTRTIASYSIIPSMFGSEGVLIDSVSFEGWKIIDCLGGVTKFTVISALEITKRWVGLTSATNEAPRMVLKSCL